MKYVVWGYGIRGKRIKDFLGKHSIIVYIDSDPNKKGFSENGIPIISYDEYKVANIPNPIIISPMNPEMIAEQISADGYKNYLYWDEVPHEIVHMRNIDVIRDLISKIDISKKYSIFGISVFSIYLYEKLLKMGCDVVLLYTNELDSVFVKYLEKEIYRIESYLDHNVKGRVLVLATRYRDEILESESNGIIEMYDTSNIINMYHNKKLRQYKEKHKGEKCVIVATGPSLRMDDLDKLRKYNISCISMNKIYYSFTKTKWRPQYYVVEDSKYISQLKDKLIDIDVPHRFIADSDDSTFSIIDSNENFENNWFHVSTALDSSRKPKFSSNIENVIYSGVTVTYSCIQLAIYMGFKEIYLLGVDFNFIGKPNENGNHFYNEGDAAKNFCAGPHQELRSIQAYEQAKEYAEKIGVKILNATRGGKLEVFQRVDFDQIFSGGRNL